MKGIQEVTGAQHPYGEPPEDAVEIEILGYKWQCWPRDLTDDVPGVVAHCSRMGWTIGRPVEFWQTVEYASSRLVESLLRHTSEHMMHMAEEKLWPLFESQHRKQEGCEGPSAEESGN